MKTDTDKYEQMKMKGNKKNMKIKEKKNDRAMPKEMRRKKENNKEDTEQTKTNKHRKPVHPMNKRLPGACNRSPGSKLLSITTQLHCGSHLGGRA